MEGYKPAEAASTLGVPSSTLRLYSVRFGPLLSSHAAHPVERGGGRPGFRIYSEQDLAVLREGKNLLEKGLTYDEALQELRRRWRPRLVRPVRERPATARPRLSPEPDVEASDYDETGSVATERRIAPVVSSEMEPKRDGRHLERESSWSALVSSLVGSLNSSQALAEEWRRLLEERNAEIATLKRRLREAEEAARLPWWKRLFGA